MMNVKKVISEESGYIKKKMLSKKKKKRKTRGLSKSIGNGYKLKGRTRGSERVRGRITILRNIASREIFMKA